MLFKIGTTVELDGSVSVIAVPASWVCDGVLFWPHHLRYFKISALRKNPASVPDKDIWIKQKFSLKATANTFSVATKLESILSTVDETEDEEADMNLKQTQSVDVQQTANRDQFFDGPSCSSQQRNVISPVTLQLKTEIEQCMTATSSTDCTEDESESKHIPEDIVPSNNTEPTCNQDALDNKISHCLQSNIDLHSKVDNLQKTLDLLLQKIGDSATVSSPPEVADDCSLVKLFQFPISSTDDLCELDRLIMQNQQFEASLIAKFTLIAGDSGRKTASKVGLKIIESIISPQLLTKYTWTGRSAAEKRTKLPFMKYGAIFSLCQKVISKADNRFNTEDCENFFKNNVLKHSSMRLARKRKSGTGTKDLHNQDAKINVKMQRNAEDLYNTKREERK